MTSSSAARTSSPPSNVSTVVEGVAILTDMFGGTPSNLAISCMGQPKVEVLAGINMPMLVKLAEVPGRMSARRGGSGSAGRRPQVRHHRQPRACREMSAGDREDDPNERVGRREETASAVLKIVNKKGLHARASAKFVQTVERFDATVKVTRGGETVGGTSIMGLMMLAAGTGTTITVEAAGNEAGAAIAALDGTCRRRTRRRGLARAWAPLSGEHQLARCSLME